MALSAYTPPSQTYGSVQNAYQSFMGQPMTRYGTGGSSTAANPSPTSPSVIRSADYGPISYGQDINTLRPQSDVTNINTWGNMPASERIQNLADRQYQDWAANRLAGQMAAQTTWNDSLRAVSGLGRQDQQTFFNAQRNMGLLPQTPTNFRDNQMEYRARQQNPWSQQTQNMVGLVNRLTLSQAGINPNSISNAYQRFMGSNF